MSRIVHRRLHAALSVGVAVLAFGALTLPVGATLPVDAPDLDAPTEPVAGQGRGSGSPSTATTSAAAARPLEGLFRIQEGECAGDGVTAGSYFRMVQPGGDVASGPFVDNADSPCGDDSYTPLLPGTDGGLSTTGYQPHPSPAFSATGHGLNDKIIQPQSFFGTRFAAATNPTDPQTSTDVVQPVITEESGELSGDVRAFAAAWNGQHFNQGSPKPDGEKPGNTAGPAGTFDPASGRYTLSWSSQIVGGPFNNFTGVWHLEGTFDGGVQVGSAAPPGHSAAAPATTASGAAGAAAATRSGQATPRTGASSAPAGLALAGLAVALRWAATRRRGLS